MGAAEQQVTIKIELVRQVFGVWDVFWDSQELISLHWTREEAEEKAKSSGVMHGPDYEGVPIWTVEEHSIPWPPPDDAP